MEVPDCCSGVAAASAPIAPARGSRARRGWWRYIGEWRARHASRRELARFNEHMLRDIGIDRHEAWREYSKPFWRK